MVPRITSKGRSFKGAGAYFLHDLGRADTAERVAFTHTVNMLTDDPETAIKVMSWTAAHAEDLKAISGQKATGRKAQNPVYNYCLAWAPDQDPSQPEMIALGFRSLQELGVSDHEALFVAHDDTPHRHLHVILNRVHPTTGLMANMGHDRNLLSRLAQSYEEETGRVYCAQRVANNRKRDLGEPNVKADNVVRLMETPEYVERRAARLQAQRQAGAHALERERQTDLAERAARNLRADFDQAAAADDRLYRAREIERPVDDEAGRAAAAWRDEQRAAKRRAEVERVERQERDRRARLDAQREQAWDTYAAGHWQQINDRHTARRETLQDRLQGMQARFDGQLDRKYAETERYTQRDVQRLEERVAKTGIRAVVDKLTGRARTLEENLAQARQAWENLQARKAGERDAYLSKLQGQREAEQQRQANDRERLAMRLDATRARKDAEFAAREQARVERLRQAQESKAQEMRTRQREAVQLVEQDHVRTVAQERAARAQVADIIGPAVSRKRGQGYGP